MATMSDIVVSNLLISGSLGVYTREFDAELDDLPVDVAATPATAHAELLALGFAHLGATIKDGSNFKETKQRTKHFVHQQRQPALVTEDNAEAVFQTTLHEVLNEDALISAYGGGTITTTPLGNRLFTPPENGTLSFFSVIVDSLYNNEITRIVMERCTTGGDTDLAMKPTELMGLPMTVDVLAPVNAASAWYRISPAESGS
jgi:hypothetical protein